MLCEECRFIRSCPYAAQQEEMQFRPTSTEGLGMFFFWPADVPIWVPFFFHLAGKQRSADRPVQFVQTRSVRYLMIFMLESRSLEGIRLLEDISGTQDP